VKLKVVVIDLELSPRARRIASAVALGLLFGGVGAIAVARVRDTAPHTWSDGETLTAADLNASFSALDSRVAMLEQVGVPVVTPWTNYVPVVTEGGVDAGASQSTVGFWRRVGDTLEVKLVTTFASCDHGGQVNWSLPNGYVVDLAKTERSETMGGGVAIGPGTSNVSKTIVVTNVAPVKQSVVAVDLADAGIGGATCSSVGSGGVFRSTFHLPVQGWSVNGP
jgi:hypothetical protein